MLAAKRGAFFSMRATRLKPRFVNCAVPRPKQPKRLPERRAAALEHLAASEAEAISALDKAAEADVRGDRIRFESTPRTTEPAAGDFVSVPSLGGKTARVMEIRGQDAIVALGSVKMTVPRATLAHADAPQGAERIQVALQGDIPELEVSSEIDLRGMRAAEIEDLVMRAVDSAVRADLKTLRFIHGKGTGALRDRWLRC
jgi:DNA mismatch repair protein MutS2